MSRVILIKGCRSCPHSHDWSSGGVDCMHPEIVQNEKGRSVLQGYAPRKEIEGSTPDWCPLQLANSASVARDAGRYQALKNRLAAGEDNQRDRPQPHFILPLFLDEYAAKHDLYRGSIAGHLDAALDLYIEKQA